MMKAKYSTGTRGTLAGMTTYTHFTSPIRRLCDLVVHQQLKAHVLGSDTCSSPLAGCTIGRPRQRAGAAGRRIRA
jgi:exoribonuclease R